MKTKPMKHQAEGVRRLRDNPERFALLCEQGTGKTWMFLADAEAQYASGNIDALLVVAPKGVHINWIRREIPEHLEAPHAAAWYSSDATAAERRELERVMRVRDEGELPLLRVVAINIDALNTPRGYAFAESFLRSTRAMMVVDESQRIKNPKSKRTDRVLKLGQLAASRRIGTGTPITNSPIDAFAQFEFLESGLLGTTSYRAFVAEYAELVHEASPLMRHIRQRTNNRYAAPQVIARNQFGEPLWRNLDKLQRLIEPHSYRVLKRDCLDLPEKIYQTRYFELPASLRAVYAQAAEQLRIELEESGPQMLNQLTVRLKLQQITSCFVNVNGEPRILPGAVNPRLAALMELVEDMDDGAQFIVWARFTQEIEQIADALRVADIPCATYYGATSERDRQAAVDGFQRGAFRAFIGQPQSGGIGLTLTAAQHVVYFSNDWSLETRLQSEDRAHRIGTSQHVVYTDLVAVNTLDEAIVRALQRKESVAAAVLGDIPCRV